MGFRDTVGSVRQKIGKLTHRLSSEGSDDHLEVNPNRRRFLQAGATAVAAGAGVSATSSGAAAYTPVGPDLITCDMARTDDSELPWSTGGEYGGWRATEHFGVSGGGVDQTPVVFVHGNNGDACNFEEHAQHLLDSGWTGDELYGITFADEAPYHEWMRDELDSFVQHVLSETGASEVNIVAHSLGVTGARFWMDDLDRFGWVDTFVSLNGGNHGVCVCPGCYDTSFGTDYNQWLSAGKSCQFIAVQCFADPDHPLYELNLPSETPGDVEYHTVRGFYDPLFYCNPYSPYLDGADNNLIYRNHTSALVDDGTKSDVDEWCSTSGMEETDASGVSWWVEADVDDYGDTYARVRIEEGANDADLEIELYNPNDEVEEDVYVYDYEYENETVIADLQMNGYDAAAEAGEWTVAVYDRDRGEYWYVDSTNFDEYNPTMVHDEYDYYQESDGDYYLDRWAITIENKGDIPLHVTDVTVEIDGETDYEYPERTLRPGDRDTYVCEDTDTWLSEGTGTYDVNFEMDVDDELWATGTFDLEVK